MKCSSFCRIENNNKVSSHRQRWHMQFWLVDTGQCWKYFADRAGMVGLYQYILHGVICSHGQPGIPPSLLLLGQTDILPTNFLIRLLVVVGSRGRPCECWWALRAGQLTAWPWEGGSQQTTTEHTGRHGRSAGSWATDWLGPAGQS